ncbi:hypothetical protein AMATHDRAFT_10056 [Amanita thiersii Skay4041]|uniref:Uncharacterized protein n=1 Tax=Amanita thiersii Skay4041 TaxID=703135 RepID=A0A2A9NA10_9AGAR|nr:hypothetical protein AMATHDRAFT_10056 [Amanita thiersii Skay4041]
MESEVQALQKAIHLLSHYKPPSSSSSGLLGHVVLYTDSRPAIYLFLNMTHGTTSSSGGALATRELHSTRELINSLKYTPLLPLTKTHHHTINAHTTEISLTAGNTT